MINCAHPTFRMKHTKQGVSRICRTCGWTCLMAPGGGGGSSLDKVVVVKRPKGQHRSTFNRGVK